MKSVIKIVWWINNSISSRLGHYLYYNFCIEECCSCNKSGLELLFENNIRECRYCKGFGYTEKGSKND